MTYGPVWEDGEAVHETARSFEEVFASSPAKHGLYLYPLVSVELTRLNPHWSGCGHFLYAGSPCEVRYRILGPLCEVAAESFRLVQEEAEIDDGPYPPSQVPRRSFTLAVDKNEAFARFLGTPQWLQPREVPKSAAGRDMEFVGQVWADHLSGECAAFVLFLFVDPASDEAVQIVQAS